MSVCSANLRCRWALLAAIMAIALLPNAVAYEAEKSDEDAIGRCVELYVAAYNRHDAEEVSALWSETGEWISPAGERFKGREAIAGELKELFASSDGLRIEVTKPIIRVVTPDVALEEGTVRVFSAGAPPSDSTYIAVHVKQDGQWRLDSVRETEAPQAPASSSALQELAWLVGDWGDADAASNASVTWAKNKTFLSYSFNLSSADMDDLEGTQIIGWDAAAGTIRSWMFDSDGGFGEGVWSRKGDTWVVKFNQVLADGRTASATNIYTQVDGNTFNWKSVGRTVDGEYLPNVEEFAITRKQKGDAEDKPVAQKVESKKKEAAKKTRKKSKN